MLLQTQNMALVPAGVHVGFVVVLLLPEKVSPWNTLKNRQKPFSVNVKVGDFSVGHRLFPRAVENKGIPTQFYRKSVKILSS